jgi:hypothetical protein
LRAIDRRGREQVGEPLGANLGDGLHRATQFKTHYQKSGGKDFVEGRDSGIRLAAAEVWRLSRDMNRDHRKFRTDGQTIRQRNVIDRIGPSGRPRRKCARDFIAVDRQRSYFIQLEALEMNWRAPINIPSAIARERAFRFAHAR